MPKSIMRLLAAFGFILCSALPGMAEPTGMPLIAGADTAGGYAGDVLVKVLPAWQPPAGASGIVTISLRIGSDGRPLYCEASLKSGNAALDESACQAVVRAGTLPTPPYGAITEVYLTFMTDPGALKGTAPPGAGFRSQGAQLRPRKSCSGPSPTSRSRRASTGNTAWN